MGDKSPKNSAKSKRQKADRKQAAATAKLPPPVDAQPKGGPPRSLPGRANSR